MTNNKPSPSHATYYRFSVAELPDELFSEDVPVEQWLSSSSSKSWLTTTTSKDGFEPGELQNYGTPTPIPTGVEIERLVGIALYMAGNVAPFAVPLLALLGFGLNAPYAKTCLYALLGYLITLFVVEYFYFYPTFNQQYQSLARAQAETAASTKDAKEQDAAPKNNKDEKIRRAQYLWTERNTTKYLSMSYVWPSDLKQQLSTTTTTASDGGSGNNNTNGQKNVIFCVIPHGLAPYGIVGYPVWSKLWNSFTCRWTCAPVILTLPIIGKFMSKIGYIPAKSKNILQVLQTGTNNVGIILDGIDGMFKNTDPNSRKEVGGVLARKGIIKIALKSGTPIIPVYSFGHISMYTIWVDKFGILQALSSSLGVSLTPFFGRWGWPLGPPHRQVVTSCLGSPIMVPLVDDPTQTQIDEYHQMLLDGFQRTFNEHKVGFYGKAKGTDKELVFEK